MASPSVPPPPTGILPAPLAERSAAHPLHEHRQGNALFDMEQRDGMGVRIVGKETRGEGVKHRSCLSHIDLIVGVQPEIARRRPGTLLLLNVHYC